jgi:hypothetical protein
MVDQSRYKDWRYIAGRKRDIDKRGCFGNDKDCFWSKFGVKRDSRIWT